MKDYLLNVARAVALTAIVAAAALFGGHANAQQQPQPSFAAPRSVVDLGLLASGTEVLAINGSGAVFTAYDASKIGSAPTTTALTLTTSAAANPPCVGCFVACVPGQTAAVCTVAPGTTVSVFNGTTLITLSAAATIVAGQVEFGTLCPISSQANPVQPTAPMAQIQAGQPAGAATGLPLSIAGHLCVYGGIGPGLQFVNFPIGAH